MKLLYITNIPAPYRQKRYNLMTEIFPKYGIDFEVLYMAEIEANRTWLVPKESYKYKYKIFWGIHPTIKGIFAHLNPGLLFRLLRNDYNIAIIGGMGSPTHWLAPYFINRDKIKIMSVESNLYSVRRTKGLAAIIKRSLIKKANAFQVTGEMQKDYISYFDPNSRNKPFIKLPNLIDEDLYVNQVDELRREKETSRSKVGVKNNEQIWLIPARLSPEKGILEFLEGIKGIEGIKVFIIGDGPLASNAKLLIDNYQLPVKMINFLQQDELIKYYAIADLFVLPSIWDSSPLTTIEAIAAELPLLLSNKIGNLNEVLRQNNGWSFEPGNIESLKECINNILKKSRSELAEMGRQSRPIYFEVFDSRNCIESFAMQLKNVANNE